MIRAAVIGLGVIGKLHAELAQLNGELVAVCDIDESRLTPYSQAKQYTDYVRMLSEVEVDVVHVCTPHYLHAEMVIMALQRNVSVLCEKPLCICNEELDAILIAEETSTAQLAVCLQNRYLSVNQFVKDFLRENPPVSAIGYMAWHRGETYYNSSPWRGKKSMEGGGVLINQALHTLDLMQYFCGEPDQVVASVSNLTLKHAIEVEDTASALFTGKANFAFFATNGSKEDFIPEIVLYTKDGTIRIVGDYVVHNNELRRFNSYTKVYGKGCYGTGHGRLFAHFYDCVKNARSFPINGSEGAKSIRIISHAYKNF